MATPHRLRHHVGVFRSAPAYMHEAMVAAYVRDATFAPMDDETLASYVAPWLAGRFEKHRTGLGAAYRMLGSTGEADDAVQEAWLRLAPILMMSRTSAGG